MKKILISDQLADDGINYLNAQKDIQINIKIGLKESEICKIIADYDVLLIRSSTKVNKKVLQAASNLKLIGRAGIGVDNIDVEEATKQGVIVMNTPYANATTTAELAIAHMFSLSRNLPKANLSVRQGKWERSKLVGAEITHKTFAILGFGAIGRLAAKKAIGLGMKVIVHDPFVTQEIFQECGVESVTFEVLLKRADYLTLHCPLIDKTQNIINTEQLNMMKKSAMLINCARGGLVNEAALYEALKNSQIAGAALDVYTQEPPQNLPLSKLDNIVFTPHLGASTREAQVAVSVEIAIQAVTYLRTGEAINALNLSTKISAEELKKSRQFMMLAKVMGKMLVNLAPNPIEKLEVSLFGKIAEVEIRPITIEALVGVLSGQFSTPINNVNAENIAKKQGLTLIESKTEDTRGYLSLVKLVGHCDTDKTVSIAGTLLGDHHPRIVNVNQFEIEVIPEGTLLITEHNDSPGVISAISSILGKSNINISRMQVGTPNTNCQAMAVISISQPLSKNLLAAVCQLPPVNSAIQITL